MRKVSDCWYKSACSNTCSDNCIRFLEMSHLMDNSNIPDNRQDPVKLYPEDADFEMFKHLNEIKADIVEFVYNGKNLYITSTTTGNGKTSWAIKLMTKYFDEVWAGNGFKTRGLFVHVPTFLFQCKDFKNVDAEFEKLRGQLLDVDLVVWDDIGGIDLSAYDYGQLLMYVDGRILRKKSNIFTGNHVTRETLQKAVGFKLASRIWSENTEIVKFYGNDRR